MPPSLIEKTLAVSNATLQQSRRDHFAGFDPFDGLNSRLFEWFPGLKSGIFGLVWIQFFKQSPVNFRRLLGVPKRRNPKGVGLFILGLLESFRRTEDVAFLQEASGLADWLLTQQCDRNQWKHSCWGYHFDWKARAFFVPKGKPNVITTIYVAQALFALADTLEALDNKKQADNYREPAVDAAHFIVNTLYTEADGRCFFAYIPGEMAFVHNASLWAAAWVAVVASYTNNDSYKTLALNVARQSCSEQGEDGSWVYGARHHHQFIDGFHTGYNLEALDLIRRSLNTNEFDQAIKSGYSYYKANFFEPDGTAKYYNNNRYPLDMHSVAQAVLTLLKLSGEDGDADGDKALADKVISHSLETLYLPEKQRFVYQKTRHFTNSINYMRWSQAWAYYALSYWLNGCK
ncbi:aspartate-semialdehyde dehydrogenase [Endozoicomonas sp.]|uniref:aspartate-semialdehyde dehydrogenase n=1 Tax=Endozoicomonas sp. TaxID=1892382 RepID=UPI003AF9AAA6